MPGAEWHKTLLPFPPAYRRRLQYQRKLRSISLESSEYDATTTLAQFQSWVNQAIKDKSWLVIVYHQIVPAGGTFQDFDTPQADFKPQLDVLKNSGVAIENLG